MTPGVSDYVAEKRKLEADLEKAKAALRRAAEEACRYEVGGKATCEEAFDGVTRCGTCEARATLKELGE